MSSFSGKEFEDLHEVFGAKFVDHNGNTRREQNRTPLCRKVSSKTIKKHRTPQLNLVVKKLCVKTTKSEERSKNSEALKPTKIMSKKFTFKPPASVAARPQLNTASVPSVQVSQGSQQLAKPMEDLWLDDIDEDMLVQASQIAESSSGEQPTPERMEIDSAAVKKFIKEESHTETGDVWTQSQRNIPQTQTVFQTRPSAFALGKEPMKRPQQNPFRMTSSKPVVNKDVGVESTEKLKAELKSYQKKLQAKEGEVKFLRNRLNERQLDMQACQNEREKIRKEKVDDLKNFEVEKKKMEEQAKSNQEFLQRELDQAYETLQKFERSNQNVLDNGDSRGSNRRQLSPENHAAFSPSQPPLKRQRMGQFAAPMNIDETLLSQKVSNTQLLVPRKVTVDTGLQTSSRRRRTKVLGLKQDELAFGSLMETGVGNGMIKSLHDTLRNQLKNLFDEIRKLSSKLQNSDTSAAEVSSKEFENAIILIDHLRVNHEIDEDQKKYPDLLLDELFCSMISLMENRQRLQDENLPKSIVNVINSIVQHESFENLIDQRNLTDNLVAMLEQSRGLLSVPGNFCLVAMDVFIGIMDLLALDTTITKKVLCNHIEGISNFACYSFKLHYILQDFLLERLI